MRILVTGGTGSLGSELARSLARENEVTIFSRDSHKQANLKAELRTRGLDARFVLGDIQGSPEELERACRGQHVLVHAAALKRIEFGETDPGEYTRVNVLGTKAAADAAAREGIGRCLFISSDKAVAPVNLYGITKAWGERYWLSKRGGLFSCLRYGNVVGSNGSVWHLWKKQAAEGKRLTVRAPEPTRFVLAIEYAVELVLEAIRIMQGGEVFVPCGLPAVSLWDIATAIAPEDCWEMEPLGPGEKQHEVLVAPQESVIETSSDKLGVVVPGGAGLRKAYASNTAPWLSAQKFAEKFPGVL